MEGKRQKEGAKEKDVKRRKEDETFRSGQAKDYQRRALALYRVDGGGGVTRTQTQSDWGPTNANIGVE